MKRFASIFAVLVLVAPTVARADAIWNAPPPAPPMMRDASLKILGIENERLRYEFRGRETSVELSKVVRLEIDSEPALNNAEDAFVRESFDSAVNDYQKVIRSTISSKPWLADWASRRLASAAERTNRFDAAVTAYVARVQFDPNAGALPRPALPDAASAYLPAAAGEIMAALGNPKLNDGQRIALLKFLIEVQRTRRETKAADAAADKLDELLAKDPTNPEAIRATARRKLLNAQALADKKDWRGAINEIESNRAQFNDPAQQSDAMYLLAEARFQIAQQTGAGASKTQQYRDAALSFMRVVAHFKDLPDRPHVAQSLLRVAQIHELIGDPATARRIYEQLAAQYPDDPSAAPARQNADRLKNAATAPAAPSNK